jgi:hypothetical protein
MGVSHKVNLFATTVTRDLEAYKRISPLLACHIRLTDAENWKKVKEVTAAAPTQPEKVDMPEKMGISLSRIHMDSARQAGLNRVRELLLRCHGQLIADVEALNKAAGEAGVHDALVGRSASDKSTRDCNVCKCGDKKLSEKI